MYVCMYVCILLLGLGCMIGERTHSRTLVGVEESTVRIKYMYVCMCTHHTTVNVLNVTTASNALL